MERARRGDAEAFGRLYDHYQASVYRFIYGQTRSTPLTEDLTADTFFRALRGIQDFKLEPELFARLALPDRAQPGDRPLQGRAGPGSSAPTT